MELMSFVFFEVVLSFFTYTVSESVRVEADLNDLSYLYSTRSLIVFKENHAKNTLFNDSTMANGNIDYHYEKGLGFFQPNYFSAISSVPLRSSSSKPEIVVSMNELKSELVSSFAVDWVQHKVFWSTFGFARDSASASASPFGVVNTVESADLSGGNRKKLYVSDATVLNSMKIDPFARKLFWIHDGCRIVYLDLDSGKIKTIVSVEYNVDILSRLALDLTQNRVFYIQTENSAFDGSYLLKSVDYDGGRAREPYTLMNKTEGIYRRDIHSLDVALERVFVFSGLFDRPTNKPKFLMLHSLVEGKHNSLERLDIGPDPLVGILNARLVHPELQPASELKQEPIVKQYNQKQDFYNSLLKAIWSSLSSFFLF